MADHPHVVVTCSNKWDLQDLHTAVLKAAGYVVEQSSTRTAAGTHKVTAKVEGSVGIPFLARAKTGGDGSYERHTERGTTFSSSTPRTSMTLSKRSARSTLTASLSLKTFTISLMQLSATSRSR
jgi:hypothetical protein